jgi:hypothetical protein
LSVKRIADGIDNTATYELSVLAGVTNNAFTVAASAGSVVGGLVGRTCAFPGVANAQIADKLYHMGMDISVGDVVLAGDSAGFAVACAADEQGTLYVVVREWQLSRRVSRHSTAWTDTGRRVVWQVNSVELPVAWYADGDSWVVVV